MKVIDIYNKIANGEKVPRFRIDDDRYKYFMKDGYLCQQKNDYEEEVVEWYIYKNWLNREIEIIEEDEFIDIEEIKLENDKIIAYYDGARHLMTTNAKDRAVYIKLINDLIKNQRLLINKLKEEGK